MPDFQQITPLERLRSRLQTVLQQHTPAETEKWGNPHAMREVLRSIHQTWGAAGAEQPTENQLQIALSQFVHHKKIQSFNQLKYIAYGCVVPIGDEIWRLIDNKKLFPAFLKIIHQEKSKTKQFRRCYQGLLSSYFEFERNLDHPGEAEKHWGRLRDYLYQELAELHNATEQRGLVPDWLQTLLEHKNLLTTDPCTRYAEALAENNTGELQGVALNLGIPRNSWVWEEAFMAHIEWVCTSDDDIYKGRLDTLLHWINGHSSIELPHALAIQATAHLVRRYVDCAQHPEHPVLRDTSVQWIGNPWLKRTAWDALVNHEPTRQMVNSWLKQRLIRDFFELLAADGAADLRRLNYWLQWEPYITDMWFALGTDANAYRTPEFLEVRKRMSGRDRRLVDNNSKNNAFIFKIGSLLIIEFGMTGNACYIYPAAYENINLEQKFFQIRDLKDKNYAAERLSHSGYDWEGKFTWVIKRCLQKYS